MFNDKEILSWQDGLSCNKKISPRSDGLGLQTQLLSNADMGLNTSLQEIIRAENRPESTMAVQ